MSGAGKKVADVAFKAGKTIDWEGMAKLLVSDEARREFATLRRAFDDVNSQLQTKFSQEPQPIDWGYYRKGIGSRLVDMHMQAYDEMKMHALRRSRFQSMRLSKTPIYNIFSSNQSRTYISSLTKVQNHSYPTLLFQLLGKQPKNPIFFRNPSISSYSSRVYKGIIPRSLRKRINKRARAAAKPVLNEALFKASISQLPPRFTPEELHDVIALQDDPLVCLELFNWASQQHRFRHNVLTFHITIKKLGVARMYEEMDYVVNQVLAVPAIASEPLYNSMIYYFCEARKLVRAVNIYRHMCDCRKLDCRPTIRTYNILFGSLLSRGHNSYINHMYMETMRCLFKQMVDDGIEPEIFCLNCMIKGYVLSLHVNDALRIFHQMGVTYKCQPNPFTYDYLIHGLCAQGRTQNAREICDKMKKSGFVPSSKSYNSLVNSLALEGEIDEAVKFLWETAENQRVADFITYRTLLDEMSRQKGTRRALRFLDKLQERKLVKGDTYQKILYELEDNSHNAYDVDSGKCS